MKYNGLDVYDITLGKDDIGIKATSLVTLPAMESQFLHLELLGYLLFNISMTQMMELLMFKRFGLRSQKMISLWTLE